MIHRQTREVIHNVFKFMKDEARNGSKIPLANYRERVLAATGISKCTYSKITSKEYINGVLVDTLSPAKKMRGDCFSSFHTITWPIFYYYCIIADCSYELHLLEEVH